MAIVGYARVSSTDQDLTIQLQALRAAGCEEIFEEKASGTSTAGRDKLKELLRFVRKGDVLVITRLDIPSDSNGCEDDLGGAGGDPESGRRDRHPGRCRIRRVRIEPQRAV